MYPATYSAPGVNNVIPGNQVRLIGEPTRVSVPGHGAGHEPQITLIRQGNTVEAIEVVCTCGERFVLNCVY